MVKLFKQILLFLLVWVPLVVITGCGGGGGGGTETQVVVVIKTDTLLYQDADGDISVADIGTKDSNKIVATSDGKIKSYAASSQDRNKIAFEVDDCGGSTIQIFDRTTQAVTQLTTADCSGTTPRDLAPRFSPDGNLIFFYQDTEEIVGEIPLSKSNLFSIPVAGGERKLLVPNAQKPIPSPDGKTLYFLSGRSVQKILLSNPTNITKVSKSTRDERNFAVAPNGTVAIVRENVTGETTTDELGTMNPDGTDYKTVTTSIAYEGSLSWNASSTKILAETSTGEGSSVVLINIATRAQEPVTGIEFGSGGASFIP